MSALLGRKESWGRRSCDCCYFGRSKRSWKRRERREWQREDQLRESDPADLEQTRVRADLLETS